jgi:hypothetical protein
MDSDADQSPGSDAAETIGSTLAAFTRRPAPLDVSWESSAPRGLVVSFHRCFRKQRIIVTRVRVVFIPTDVHTTRRDIRRDFTCVRAGPR